MSMSPANTQTAPASLAMPGQRQVISQSLAAPAPSPNLTQPPSDQFSLFSTPAKSDIQRMAVGVVNPRGDMSLGFKVYIDQDGKIYQPSLSGFKTIGKMDTRGNYRFENGLQGNSFRDGQFDVSIDRAENPFQRQLVQTKQQRASAGSIIPMIRQELTSKGIDGSGITVADIEPFQEDKKNKQLEVSPHTLSVAAVIQDPFWGVAPGAKVQNFGWFSPDYELEKDDLAEFNQLKPIQQLYQEMNAQLNRVREAHQQDPSLRVVNISWGLSPLEFYIDTLETLHAEDEKTGMPKYPKIQQAVLGKAAEGTPEEQFQAVAKYIDQRLQENPVFNQWHQQFVEITKQAADEGITIVASAANSRDQMLFHTPVPVGSELDVWLKSPYVIGVAASDTNLTPNDTSDDVIAPFSSRGDGKQWNPTIAAPGAEIGLSQQYGHIGRSQVTKGTSYSSPITAGVIAMMLQQDPTLTFNDIRDHIIKTATDTPAGFDEEGYGMLNPIQAVQRVAKKPETTKKA